MSAPVYGTLASLIIDDICFSDGRKQHNVLGGAGVFAVYGMRLWLPQRDAHQIGFIVQKGDDHPANIDEQLAKLDITLLERKHPGERTTRGLNVFGTNDHRDFTYIHPILRTTPDHVPDDWINSLRMIHVISAAERAKSISHDMRARRTSHDPAMHFIWEPLPDACISENFGAICEVARTMTVFSPNHEEAAALLGSTSVFDHVQIEAYGKALFRSINTPPRQNDTVIVIRAGKLGSVVIHNVGPARWVPSYHNNREAESIKDVTGAGNAFCGGFAVGWIESGCDPIRASMYGAVSASFAIEQVGMPTLHPDQTWNLGPSPRERLQKIENLVNKT